jgi:peptidyl-dipeptidase Dcp
VCNFTKPTETKPSLLTFNEVTTLFHEFGHALHGMLANTTYQVYLELQLLSFVELPSQVMENWCYEPEALALLQHITNGRNHTDGISSKIKESSNFQEEWQPCVS